MNITQRITRFLKSAVTAVVAVASLTATTALADNTPRFNQLEGDKELLTGRNITQGQTEYIDPVSVTDNDVVRVRVWYHNDASLDSGATGATAVNTTVRVSLPFYGVSEGSTTHLMSATVGADNTGTVAGTVVNGVEVGQPGLRINSDRLGMVQFIPGSVKWYPNGTDNPVDLPNGQNGDAIISGTGISLGDIAGCWPYAGMVTLDVKLNPVGSPVIERSKTAINETQGSVPAHTVSANPGDVIAYTLTTNNTGLREQTGLVVSDDIKDVLEYATVIDNGGGAIVDGVISYPSETLAAGQQVAHIFKVQVKPASEWPTAGNFVMTNVYGNAVDVPVTPPVKPLDIFLKKEVRSLSVSGDYLKEITVGIDSTLEYRLVVKNTGQNLLSKVSIHDTHDSKLKFVSGTVTMTRDGKTATISDNIFATEGYTLDTPLKVGEELTIIYRMKIDTATTDRARLCNDVTAGAEGISAKKDTACVVVSVPATPTTSTPTPTPTPEAPAVAIPTLPQTGPADMMFALLGVVSGGATTVRYRRAKRAVARAASDIAVL